MSFPDDKTPAPVPILPQQIIEQQRRALQSLHEELYLANKRLAVLGAEPSRN